MEAQIIAGVILLPFIGAFIYAGVHAYSRYKSEGPANYGLVYDEETGTTYVSAIPDGGEAYNLDEFDPNAYREPDAQTAPEADTAPEDETEADATTDSHDRAAAEANADADDKTAPQHGTDTGRRLAKARS